MANLPITTDTSQLAGLEKALNSIVKVVGRLATTAPALSKVLDSAATSAERLAKAQNRSGREAEENTAILDRQKNILKGMVAGYSKGESSILATARAAGVAKDVFQELEKVLIKQREISGKNPFDDTIGATRKLKSEIQALDVQFDALAQGQKVTRAEAEEYVRTLNRAKMAAEQMAGDPAEWASQASYIKFVNKVLDEQTAEYKQLTAEKKRLQQRNEEIIKTQKTSEQVAKGLSKAMRGIVAQGLDNAFAEIARQSETAAEKMRRMTEAGKRVEDTLGRMRVQAVLMASGFTKEAASGVFAFEQQARAAGKSEVEIRALTNAYLGLQKEMQTISAQNRRTASSFLGLQGILRTAFPAIGALGFGAVLAQVGVITVQTADSLTLLSNKLTVATSGAADFGAEFANILRIANESRTSVQDVGTLYARLIPVVSDLGGTTKEAAAITESFSKLLLIGGTNTREASAAIIQFSQALGKGKLDGDEFRSIAEATPEVLRLLEQSLGKTRAELFEMSKNGELTADVLGNTLIGALEGLDARLLGLPLTAGQAFQVLKNNLTDSVRLFEEGTGSVGGFSSMIQSLATFVYDFNRAIESGDYAQLIEDMKDLGTWVGAAAVALGVARTATLAGQAAYNLYTGATTGATFATKVFNAVLGANPLVKAATLILGVVTALVLMKDTTFEVNGSLVDLGSLATSVFEGIGNLFSEFSSYVDPAKEAIGGFYDLIASGASQVLSFLKGWANGYIGILVGIGEVGTLVWNGFEDAAKAAFKDVGSLVSAFFSDLTSGDLTFKRFNTQLSNSFKEGFKLASQAVTTFSDAYKKDYLGNIAEDIRLRGENIILRAEEIKQNKDYEAILDDLIEQNERIAEQDEAAKARLAELIKLRQGAADATDSETKAKKKKSAEEKLEKQMQEELEALLKDYNEQAEISNRAYAEQYDSIIKATAAVEEEVRWYGLAESAKQQAILTELELKRTRGDTSVQLEDMIRQQERYVRALQAKEGLDAQKKLADETAKEFEKIAEDVGKIFGEAIFKGGQDGTKKLGESIKDYFRTLVVRLTIEPAMKTLGKIGSDFFSTGKLDLSSLGSSLSTVAAGISGGQGGAMFSKLAQNADSMLGSLFGVSEGFAQSAYAFTKTGQQLVGLSNTLGKVAPYAGSIVQALQGDLKGAAKTAAGTYIGTAIGNMLLPGIGGAIGGALGSIVGGLVGGSGKISARGLDPSFGTGVIKNLNEQYAATVASLGGTALSNVNFGAGGNTGRQGQNNNFTLNAAIGGRNVFNSRNTREGQADGLFLAGEIALNEANLADQSLRALFSVFKETNFASNINEVIDRVDLFSASFEDLNNALSDAQLLKTINEEFPKLGGALATLAGQSIDTVKTFVLLAGGFENLQSLQNSYISSIYTEEEKLALATDNLKAAFTGLNLSVPTSTQQFKALVEAQNLSTVEGQATYLALLQLSGAFAEITKANEEATRAAREAAEEVARAAQEKILEERINLEKELYELITSSTQQLQDQRNALDESNRALFDQIQLVKAEQAERERQNAILEEKLGLESELLNLQGNTNELRRLEREALDESNRSLYDQIKALEDANALRDELTQKIQTQEGVITGIENRILTLQQEATQNYLTAQQKVAQAQGRVNDLILETARSFLNLGKTLRDFVSQQRQSTSVGSFQDTVAKALAGDSVALAKLPEIAGQAIAGLESTARSSLEVEQRKAAILDQVSMAAAVAEALGAAGVQEDPLVVAQRELAIAQNELTNALSVANTLNAPLVQVQRDLVTEYTKALTELASANTTLNDLLAALNLVNGVTPQTQGTVVNTSTGQVTMPVSTQATAPTITAPTLELQISALTAKVDQLIIENRAGQQAIANNTAKSARVLERADDGDAINVRVLP